MIKKTLSCFVVGLLVFNLSTVSYAQAKSSEVNTSLVNVEQLVKQNLTENEKEKINNDYGYLKKCNINVDLITDIKVNDGKNVYNIEYPNNINESITVEYKDGAYILDVIQGNDKKDHLVIKDGNMYLDGNKIEEQRANIVVSNVDTNKQDITMPMADRDMYNTLSAPYGSSADYNSMQRVESCSNVELHKFLKDMTVSVLSSILGYYVFVGLVGSVASGVSSGILSAFSGSTSSGLSYKNYIYYHKNGYYISAIGGNVLKNNVRWYEKISYGGKSTVIPTYSVYKQY